MALHRRYEDRHSAPWFMTNYVAELDVEDAKTCLENAAIAYQKTPSYQTHRTYIEAARLLTHRPDLLSKWANLNILLDLAITNPRADYASSAQIVQHMAPEEQEIFADHYTYKKIIALHEDLDGSQSYTTAHVHAWPRLATQIQAIEKTQRTTRAMPLLAQMMHPNYIARMTVMVKTIHEAIHDYPHNHLSEDPRYTPLESFADLAALTIGFPDLHGQMGDDLALEMSYQMLKEKRLSAFAKMKYAFQDDSYKSRMLEKAESLKGFYSAHISNRSAMHHHNNDALATLDATLIFEPGKKGTKVSISTFRDRDVFKPVDTLYRDWNKAIKQKSMITIGAAYEVEMTRATLRMLAGIADGYDYAILPDGPRKANPDFVRQAALQELQKIEKIRHTPRFPKAAQAMRDRFADARGGVKGYRHEGSYGRWEPHKKPTPSPFYAPAATLHA